MMLNSAVTEVGILSSTFVLHLSNNTYIYRFSLSTPVCFWSHALRGQ
jgi:hypothetical protein